MDEHGLVQDRQGFYSFLVFCCLWNEVWKGATTETVMTHMSAPLSEEPCSVATSPLAFLGWHGSAVGYWQQCCQAQEKEQRTCEDS